MSGDEVGEDTPACCERGLPRRVVGVKSKRGSGEGERVLPWLGNNRLFEDEVLPSLPDTEVPTWANVAGYRLPPGREFVSGECEGDDAMNDEAREMGWEAGVVRFRGGDIGVEGGSGRLVRDSKGDVGEAVVWSVGSSSLT